MPVWIAAALGALGKVAISLLMSLMTESFIKSMIVHALQSLAKKTASDADDKLVNDIKTAWNVPD